MVGNSAGVMPQLRSSYQKGFYIKDCNNLATKDEPVIISYSVTLFLAEGSALNFSRKNKTME